MNPVFHLSSALVDDWAALRPVDATFAGVPGHDHRWGEWDPEGNQEAERRFRSWIARFEAVAVEGEGERLARDVALDWLRDEVARLGAGDAEVDLNSLASPVQLFAMVFGSMETGTEAGWEAVAARLEALPAALEGYRRTLAAGLGRADGVAARQVRAGIAHARRSASGGYLPDNARCPSASLVARIDAARPGAAAAWAGLADWLEGTLLPQARETDGVGRDRYLREMRRFLGAEFDPEETYAWGWEELARIEAEMAREAEALGARSVAEAFAMADAVQAAPDDDTFLDAMRARQARALALVDTLFDIPAPVRRLDVKMAPPTGHIGAYYVPPSEDFSRPGAVWYLRDGVGPHPTWREVSTAYHEGFPGHHLQLGVQVSLPGRSRFQRVVASCSGFAEGWALYVEQLMDEVGGYEHPAFRLGMLANQHIRACRVVLDIGAHLDLPIPAHAPFAPGERWTYERGVTMLTERGGMTPGEAASEMTRYLGFPAQAISYKVGQRAMLALRQDWIARGGALRDFHARVLGLGNVGLARLAQEVR
jgi:uncharacterized protein (DUF885 family)